MKAKPYVYVLCNRKTGQYYIGSRRVNNKPATQDFLKEYFTSSPIIQKELITSNLNDFSYVLCESNIAMQLEGSLLRQYAKDTNCLNKMKGGAVSMKRPNRPLCQTCKTKPVGVNYYKNGKTYYRKKCDGCLRPSGVKVGVPSWQRSGYEIKNYCEKCGYKSRHAEQFNVFHIDGDLTNCKHKNLKTVCANCQRILHKEDTKWKQGDLIPDVI